MTLYVTGKNNGEAMCRDCVCIVCVMLSRAPGETEVYYITIYSHAAAAAVADTKIPW